MVATTVASDPTRGRMPLPAESLLIDQFMPTYDLAVVHSRVFRASPERCFETVVDFDLFQLRAFRVLIGARGLCSSVRATRVSLVRIEALVP